MGTPRTPACRLVLAFGDVEATQALYAPDIAWSLPASLPYPRPMSGKDAVIAFNTGVWTDSYFPDCSVTILDEVGDDGSSAVRFVYRARLRRTGKLYENEYALFARSGPLGITEVFEAMDSLAILDQLAGAQPGATFTQFIQAR
jgi:ketosteroid isomerase-like protein